MNRRTFQTLLAIAGTAWFSRRSANAEESGQRKENMNLDMPTLGGMQFWTDELFFHDLHIQRNSFSGHCRLLDGKGRRLAWGTFEQCQAELESIKLKKKLPPMSGRAVILLHGLAGWASQMKPIARGLDTAEGYTLFNVNYASTRAEVSDHAAALAKIIAHLDGIEEINFVAHSLGNLVTRHYLADAMKASSGKADPRWKRMVMLGPPNQGATIAEAICRNAAAECILGESSQQLARNWSELAKHLATPPFEFGIIAGGRGADRGFNPLLTGDNDLIVTVESTRLPGAADFVVLPVLHRLMMDSKSVQEYTRQFLKQGYFVSAEERRPIR
jgi:pimeloyl-ACP methyl ester carboxylesterase